MRVLISSFKIVINLYMLIKQRVSENYPIQLKTPSGGAGRAHSKDSVFHSSKWYTGRNCIRWCGFRKQLFILCEREFCLYVVGKAVDTNHPYLVIVTEMISERSLYWASIKEISLSLESREAMHCLVHGGSPLIPSITLIMLRENHQVVCVIFPVGGGHLANWARRLFHMAKALYFNFVSLFQHFGTQRRLSNIDSSCLTQTQILTVLLPSVPRGTPARSTVNLQPNTIRWGVIPVNDNKIVFHSSKWCPLKVQNSGLILAVCCKYYS